MQDIGCLADFHPFDDGSWTLFYRIGILGSGTQHDRGKIRPSVPQSIACVHDKGRVGTVQWKG